MTTFHINGLDKQGAIAIARHLGLRRDWARVKLAEIYSLLRPFGPDRLTSAAQALPDVFNNDDLALLTDPEQEFEDESDDDTSHDHDTESVSDAEVKYETTVETATVQAKPAPAKPAPEAATQQSAKQPDVTQVAALLAQLLATGKAGLDAGEVEQIVAPMLDRSEKIMMRACNNMLTEAIKGIPAREITVNSDRGTFTVEGTQHRDFETLLQLCAARQPDGHRLNVWLYGPPGTGKTTAAKNAAKALGMPFYCNGALSTKYELIGFKDAGGTYQRTPFRDAWENGGVYLFDEIDGSDPKAVVAFNSALANGIMAFPDGMIERHADCVMIAASNTVHGATSEFTGRMKLDAATIDRFVFMEWEIDEVLERAMCPNADWVKFVQSFRRKVKDKGVKIQVTPRATLYGASLLNQGMPIDLVKRVALRKAMTAEQWQLIGE